MTAIPWWRNTIEGSLGQHFDWSDLGSRELLQQALKSDARLYLKVYNGFRKHADIESFVSQISERLKVPVTVSSESTGSTIYWLINAHSSIKIAVDIFRENAKNTCKPYHAGGFSGTPVCDGVHVYIHTLRKEDIETVDEICSAELEERPEAGVVEVLVREGLCVTTRTLGKVTKPLIRDNYAPHAVKQIDALLGNLESKSPTGRLTIINGEPGTGKTHLLQGLLHELEGVTAWFVPPALLADLAGPQLLGVLLGRDTSQPLLMLLEDGDTCLISRGSDNMSSIQALLNIADGFIGQMLNIHVVVTTNARTLDIDRALLRPGRLHQQINIEILDPRHAEQIFERLTGRHKGYGCDAVPLAQVYKDATE